MTNTTKQRPADLHDAYEWTDAAGELDELRGLSGDELDRYCAESAENSAADGDGSVTASALRELAAWLKMEAPAK